MALFMLLVGAFSVVGGAAMLSVPVAVICGGVLVMAGAVAVAVVQDRKAALARNPEATGVAG